MPSRKRNKGKERKAKKAVLEFERIDNERAEVRNYWLGWARGEDEVRQITQCNHGCDLLWMRPNANNHPVTSFMDAFVMNTFLGTVKHILDNLRDTSINVQKYWMMTVTGKWRGIRC